MNDLNDLTYFVAVVKHGGFSAAARAAGLDKTRLSRRIAALEQRLGVRLLQRNTRVIALTEAGERFYNRASLLVADAQGAFDSIADMRTVPAGTVRLSCPHTMAQTLLAPILPRFLAQYPQVRLELDASDRHVDLLRERFDLALRARVQSDESAGLVARELGRVRRILVASPGLLERTGRPAGPDGLQALDTLAKHCEMNEGKGCWTVFDGAGAATRIEHQPRIVVDDLKVQLAAAVEGTGVALLPETLVRADLDAGRLEVVLPQWAAAPHVIHLLYPPPRGILPSVRSLIDYLSAHVPARFAA
jgi:DNA-binding transcriptional LysR family regulator